MTSLIQVFDPPLCCSTGVCGTDVDAELVRFAADLEWLTKQGVKVERVNLAQEPGRFATNALVAGELAAARNDCLPLILVAGSVVSRGRYPTREELAKHAELDPQITKVGVEALRRTDNAGTEAITRTDNPDTKALVKTGACCSGDEPAPPKASESGCCGGAAKTEPSRTKCC